MITIYHRNNCPQCRLTMTLFGKHNIPYRSINVDSNSELITQLKSEGFNSVPVVRISEDNAWSGFQPAKINAYVASLAEA